MALIGNPMDFDRIRQKYESLVYPQGRTQDTNFNRVRDSYSSLLSQPGTDPLTGQPTNMGVLTGQGSQTINRDATQGGEQVQLRFNPATGQTETIIPEYMGGFRSDQQDFLPNTSPFQTIYDVNEGMIDPVTGAPKPDPLLGTSTAVPSALPAITGGGGDGRDRLGTMQTSKGYDPYGTFDRAIGSQTESAITTALGALTGVPFGLLSGIDKQLATKQLSNTFGIDKKDIDSIQKDIESGMTTKEAMDKFRDTSEKHKVGRDFIGTGRVDPNFGMVSDDKLRELTKEGEADFDAMLDDEDETTGIVNTVGNFFSNLFGGDQGGQDQDRNTGTSTGSAASAAAADARDRAAREAASQPTSSPERKDVQDNKARRDAVDKMNSSKPSRSFGRGTGKGQQGQSRRGGDRGGRRGGRGQGQSRCFVKGTMLEMADGTTKEITTITPGMETRGGTVEFVLQGLPVEIWDYKGVKVSGTHWVVENDQLIAVEDSKHGIKTDMIEPVYSMKTSKQRMWINDIEFGDFESGTDEDWEPHFEMIRQKLNKELRDGK